MMKDNPIKLVDGTELSEGMILYYVLETSDHKVRIDFSCYRRHTGKSCTRIVNCEVLNVNQAANARCFTVRDMETNGETVISVRNANPSKTLFGTLENAHEFELKRNNDQLKQLQDKKEELKNRVEDITESIESLQEIIFNLSNEGDD